MSKSNGIIINVAPESAPAPSSASPRPHWDRDEARVPVGPWSKWDEAEGCWCCRSCGAPALRGIHREGCVDMPTLAGAAKVSR